MKGTIDPVDAIFTAFSGLGGRVLSFFVSCWVGFALGTLAATVTWGHDVGLQIADASQNWSLVPITWIFITAIGCLRWWGPLHLLALIVAGYRLIISEANVCLSVCFLFLMEAWLWWAVASHYIDFDFRESDSSHPLLIVLGVISAAVLWLAWRTWKREHPSPEPEHFAKPRLKDDKAAEPASEGTH